MTFEVGFLALIIGLFIRDLIEVWRKALKHPPVGSDKKHPSNCPCCHNGISGY